MCYIHKGWVGRDSELCVTYTRGGWGVVLVRYQVLFDTDRYLNFVRYSILDTYVVIKSNFHIEHISQ